MRSLRSRKFLAAWLMLLLTPCVAADLYQPGSDTSLIADRRARQVGDLVTVLVYENSMARNSSDTSADSRFTLSGSLDRSGGGSDHVYGARLGNSRNGGGRTQRSGNVLAQISVTVDEIASNGDLHINGEQSLNVNGEITRIKLSGRVRPADIDRDNVVLSSRVADARIDYVGEGDLSRRSRPGLISWLLSFFRPW